jgi:hypothetical protein
MDDNDLEDALDRPMNWLGRIMLFPRKKFYEIRAKVSFGNIILKIFSRIFYLATF